MQLCVSFGAEERERRIVLPQVAVRPLPVAIRIGSQGLVTASRPPARVADATKAPTQPLTAARSHGGIDSSGSFPRLPSAQVGHNRLDVGGRKDRVAR